MNNQKTRCYTYWNWAGAYPSLQEKYEGLVPGYGKSDTLFGEMLRAGERLYYDFYNNGLLNNTSGAVNFLMSTFERLKVKHYPQPALMKIYEECNAGGYTDVDLKEELEEILNYLYVFFDNHQNSANEESMFDYQDEDFYEAEDDYSGDYSGDYDSDYDD